MSKLHKDGVVILDFGSQYTQLIARKIREQNVYSEIVPAKIKFKEILKKDPAAIILSGGPSSVFENQAPNFDKEVLDADLPILGICYGLQLLAHHNGGVVETTGVGEYGFAEIEVNNSSGLFKNIPKKSQVWMSHMDRVTKLPKGWEVLAYSSNKIIASMSNKDQSRVATQFHPEVVHSHEGVSILRNFLFNIAQCSDTWTAGNFIDEQVAMIKQKVGKDNVLVGVSGGVDSSVVAALLHKAIGSQSKAVLIDHGLLRLDEAKNCVASLKEGLGVSIKSYNESNKFLSKLSGVEDPEKKRKIIGNQFIDSFEDIAKQYKSMHFLAQGTLYPDVIESGVSKSNSAHIIKSHHNVGGLPDHMNFKLLEPLRELFKDEVRRVGEELGIPQKLIQRHPFPGPGLAVRIIGNVTKERVSILQKADQVYLDILQEDGLYNDIWQAFAVLIPVKTVGVMGDQRTYENLLAIRAVTSTDGMTADWYKMPSETLNKISNCIINSVSGINRVVYDITSKPPGTIEWE